MNSINIQPAASLKGFEIDDEWIVEEKLTKPPSSTGGNFCIGYLLRNKNTKKRAFLKALDYSRAFNEPDQVEALNVLTEAYKFERDLLVFCSDSKMKNVVQPIGSGYVRVPGGYPEKVDYVILELADGDIRQHMETPINATIHWKLSVLCQIAKGLNQLHSEMIAHQDLKPSNILLFSNTVSKVSDLGCCSKITHAGPRDHINISGDPAYAPPEQFYESSPTNWRERRVGCDLYHLGSLVLFLFARVNMTPKLFSLIPTDLHYQKYGGDYSVVLPYLLSAWSTILADFRTILDVICPSIAEELVLITEQLTNPDIKRRGDSKGLNTRIGPYNLERFISRFRILELKAKHLPRIS